MISSAPASRPRGWTCLENRGDSEAAMGGFSKHSVPMDQVFNSSGDHDEAVRLTSELIADQGSTLGTETLTRAMLKVITIR